MHIERRHAAQLMKMSAKRMQRIMSLQQENENLKARIRRLQRVIAIEQQYQPDEDFHYMVGSEEAERIINELVEAYSALEDGDLDDTTGI